MELIFSHTRFLLILCLLLSGKSPLRSHALNIGINYGQVADNLPTPTQVSSLLRSLSLTKIKLYDANPKVLSAFANTGTDFTISLPNEAIPAMTDSNSARSWVQTNLQPFLPATSITSITVGNEILSGSDESLISNLLPAMQSMHQALASLNLTGQVSVTTAHSLAVLSDSYPPSSGSFRQDLAGYVQPILNFLAQTNAPFLINAYPYFAYKASPGTVSLNYVLFEPNPGFVDPVTKLNYDNMLYAQIDSVYAAMREMGRGDVAVKVSETGWPSRGDVDEVGATPENAAAYNGNLLRRVEMGEGTPMRPEVPVDVYLFALFNEDMKPGPTSERNYGLFYPNGSEVYNFGLQGSGGGGGGNAGILLVSGSAADGLRVRIMTGVFALVSALAFLAA